VAVYSGKLKELASPGVHEKVLEIMLKFKRGKVLDAGAGTGSLSKKLAEVGFQVFACDKNAKQFKAKGIKFKQVDFDKSPLPYSNDFFDYAVCVEVVEHLLQPFALLKELNRVLKRNGYLILTTPNILDWASRVKFLRKGEYYYFTIPDFKKYHITPLHFYQLENYLEKAGFKIVEISTNLYGKTDLLLRKLPFTVRLIERIKLFILKILFYIVRPKPKAKELLLGDILIIVAQKSPKFCKLTMKSVSIKFLQKRDYLWRRLVCLEEFIESFYMRS
jgi:2-polyprenyl-3-methyl-5-hydroxy-6-metoxy-1,4-benzoquinol methylase